MDNNLVLNRIQNRMASRATVASAFQAIQAVTQSQPISLEELKAILMGELMSEQVAIAPCTEGNIIHFNSIYDFTQWYGSVRHKFSPQQQLALDTLETTRTMIDSGCACRRASREHVAHAYFGEFWTKNQSSDLLPTIAKITGAERVSISSFCSYPSAAVPS